MPASALKLKTGWNMPWRATTFNRCLMIYQICAIKLGKIPQKWGVFWRCYPLSPQKSNLPCRSWIFDLRDLIRFSRVGFGETKRLYGTIVV